MGGLVHPAAGYADPHIAHVQGAAAVPQQPQVWQPTGPPSDPRQRLSVHGFPRNIEEWAAMQHLIWENHPPIPAGWLRCWSRSRDSEYYVRLADMATTFDASHVA